MTSADMETWLERYVRAWTTNDPADVAPLFAADATYATAPYREPWRGREAIVVGWLERTDEPGSLTFRPETLAVAGDFGVVRGRTTYADPPTAYANLFLVRLDGQGRCVEFTESWMKEERTAPSPRQAAPALPLPIRAARQRPRSGRGSPPHRRPGGRGRAERRPRLSSTRVEP